MADSPPRRCGMSSCTSGLPARLYPAGYLCGRCCPSAVAGTPHPDELLVLHRARLAELAAGGDPR